MVAGLRQLDRLALSLDEYAVAVRSPGPIPVCISWISGPPETGERLPQHPRLTHLSFTDNLDRGLHVIHRGFGQNAVARVEDVAGTRAGALQ